MSFDQRYFGQPFDAKKTFGATGCLDPRVQTFCDVVVASLSEFDGRIINDALAERIEVRVQSLQAVASEFAPA